jgi:hypothetical protein
VYENGVTYEECTASTTGEYAAEMSLFEHFEVGRFIFFF